MEDAVRPGGQAGEAHLLPLAHASQAWEVAIVGDPQRSSLRVYEVQVMRHGRNFERIRW